MSKITLLDLEKISGVSKTTISRYLSGSRVSQAKVKKIEEAIAASGYIRNNFAQLLRTTQSNLIGVIVPDLDNPFFLKIIKRLEELASHRGKTLIIKTTQRSVELELKSIDFIRGFMVEALFLCRSELTDYQLSQLKIEIPVFSLDKEFNNVYSIISNNYQSSFDLTTHLLENCDRNLLFFSRLYESNSVHERIRGFRDACSEKRKIPYEFKYNVDLPINFDALLETVKSKAICGIICRNDNEAVKVQSYFNDMFSRKLINRIKVCGFDNITLSKHVIPTLTTVDQEIEEMCDIAFHLFINKDFFNPRTIIHEAKLLIRDSTR